MKEIKGKTCNGGMCAYKTTGGVLPGCNYPGYCDYQCPKCSQDNTYKQQEVQITRWNPNHFET